MHLPSSALLLEITRADVGRMLWFDALDLVLGIVLLAVALAAAAAYLGFLRKEPALAWFSLFALAYGLRLLAQTDSVRLLFDKPPIFWDHVISIITYTIGLPVVLFLREMFPAWSRPQGWIAIFLGVFATGAMTADIVLGRSYAAQTMNNLIAITFLFLALGLLFRPGLTRSRELTALRVGLVGFAIAALVDNLRGLGVPGLPGYSVEPVGFALLIACLGTVVASRIVGNAQRLLSLDKELSIARRIQDALLPLDTPKLAGLTIAARYRPMTAVAGDFYDFVELDDQRLGVLVADVSGHGVPAALIASMVKIALAAQRPHAERPADVLSGMNQALSGQLGGQYVTAAYLFIDREAGLMRYGAAGHPPLLRSFADRRLAEPLEENGLPLGLMDAAHYTQVEHPLRSGDRFVLYTDGLVEAANEAGEFFGLERVKAIVTEAGDLSTNSVANKILEEMGDWAGANAGDDLTLVVVDCA
jgi:sigma-B regulation protein RsbU (phosphoserine phosphatase)